MERFKLICFLQIIILQIPIVNIYSLYTYYILSICTNNIQLHKYIIIRQITDKILLKNLTNPVSFTGYL